MLWPSEWPYTPHALWMRDCPLGRYFDAIDSDEEDAMDAAYVYTLRYL